MKKNALIIILGATVLLVIGLATTAPGSSNLALRNSPSVDPETASPRGESKALVVTVQNVQPSQTRPEVRAYGEARARFRTVLSAEVSGALVSIDPRAHAGQRVAKGNVLMTLEDSRLTEALARARADLEQARLQLAEEELQAKQAIADWQRIGGHEPPSEFLSREPQRSAARMEVEAREAALFEAQNNLDRATIRAPFDAVVVRRIASLGSFVQAGTELIEVDSTQALEVRVPLGPAEWSLLPSAAEMLQQGWPVELEASALPANRWTGKVSRIEQHVESESRQRHLIVEVSDPLDQDPPFLSGTFVRATLAGQELDGIFDLPASAVTETEDFWFVDREGLLERAPLEVLAATEGRVLGRVPEKLLGPEGLDVLIHPMTSYVPGLTVERRWIDDIAP